MSAKSKITTSKKRTVATTAAASSSRDKTKGFLLPQHLQTITPMTETQRAFVSAYDAGGEAFVLHGVAGTGKTFIALYKALQDVIVKSAARRVILIRSSVPSRDIGFLPGDADEKMGAYHRPYMDICARLFKHPQAYEKLAMQEQLEFWSTSFVRGVTLDHAVIVVDECQNMTDMELNSIMTRVGTGSKILFCGDFRQTDLYKKSDASGLIEFMDTVSKMPQFAIFEFGVDDIVRSPLVKSYILARLAIKDAQQR
jgi:phosphate starvation-inducible protein PhoH